MAMAEPAHAAPPDGAVIDFEHKEMTDDCIHEILLRFPCSASLACAAFHSRRLRRIVSNDNFLKLFRKRHPSSPLLGIFSSWYRVPLPLFQNVASDTILNGVICRADTGLAYLDKNKSWHLEDCRNGRLLLCSGGDDNSFCIYDPLSQRRVDCGSRPYGNEGDYINSCLLAVEGQSSKAPAESFRIVCLQRRRSLKSQVRAVEYHSGKLEWRADAWNNFSSMNYLGCAMHAAGHIFSIVNEAFLLVLDINTMEFSMEHYPWQFGRNFSIGELEDGKGCAVCFQGLSHPGADDIYGLVEQRQRHMKVRLQVWTIEKNEKKREEEEEKEKKRKEERGIFDWEMKEEFFASKILDKDAWVYEVTKVVNGLVVICHGYNKDHYVINLQSKTLVAKFNNPGPEMPHLYQLPWPPSVLAGATTMASKHIAGDEVSKQCPINNKDGPAITEERHNDGDEVSKQCPANKDGPATTEERHITHDEVSKQYPSNNKDGPTTTDDRYPLMTVSFDDIMRSVDQINLGENSPEATASSALVANTGKMLEPHESLQDGDLLNITGLFYDIMPRMDQINLGENSREATVSSALVNNTGEMMEQHKILQEAYPINMTGATTMASFHKKHIDGDEVSKECPINKDGLNQRTMELVYKRNKRGGSTGNKKDGPATTEDTYIAGDEENKQCPSNNKDVPTTTEERAKETTSKDICQFNQLSWDTWSYECTETEKGEVIRLASAKCTENDSTKHCCATAGKCPCGWEVIIPFGDKLASGVEDKELGLAPTWPKRKAKGVSNPADTEEPFDDKLAIGVEDKELGLAPRRKAKAPVWYRDYILPK